MQMLIPMFKELGVKSIISLGIPVEAKTVKLGNCEVHTWLSTQQRQECHAECAFHGGV